MRPGKSGKAFALAYTLLVSAVIMLFAGALFIRATESMRVSGLDVTSVHATALADTGAQLAYSLLRDHDPQYFKTRNPLRSVDLGPEFARNVIGGSFEVQVDDADYTATGLYPNNGTFYTIISTGRVGNHVARTEMILKMTNPLLNYLFLAPEDLRLEASRTVVGPIVVNADPASGDRGNLSFGHDEDYWSVLTHRYEHLGGDLRLDIQARATGDISIRNSSDHGYTQAPLQLNGRYAPQSFQHQDHVILAAGGSWQGNVVLTDDCALEANAKFTTRIPTMDQLLKAYRAGTGPAPVDISGEAGGVLVEFVGGQAFVSQATTRQVGRVYDRAHALESNTYLTDLFSQYYGISQAAAQVMLDTEVDWNDPAFPDRPYPADLGPGTGDYVDVYRIERGATLQSYALSGTSWTTIYLTTSRTDYLTADGRRQGPPVFVRGMVDGKCMVVYDVTDNSLDPQADRLHSVILGQHEDPADSPGYKLPTGGAPGVVGGLLYADRAIKSDPDQVTFTNDRLLLLCRGTITGGGEPAVHRGRMHDMADAPYDYESVLKGLEQSYSMYYTGTTSAPDFRVSSASSSYWSNGPYAHFYGIAVSAHSDQERWRLSSLGQVVDRPSDDYPAGGITTWDDLGVAAPPTGVPSNNKAFFPWGLRHVRTPENFKGDVRGSFHSIQTAYDISGNAYYDYSWQALKEHEIRQELFLPVQPVMSSFQRL